MAENVMNSLPESKYTDPTPTSSASFKPPRSKESMLKNKKQTPQAEGWFSTFSYIKTIFTGKSVKDNSAKKVFNDHKEAQIDKKSYNPKNDTKQREKKTENLTKVSSKQEDVLNSRGQHNPSLILTNSKPSALNKLKTDTEKKSSFGFSHKEIDSPEKKKSEQEQQQTPSYTPLRFVDNRSTYLHAPDKKGTTSFRVTTGPTVNAKPMYSASSPAPIRIMSSKRFASPTRSRDKMTNRKKALSPRKMADNIISSQFRLRSKSTPDRSTFKARPVSLSASQKSLSLNPESQKVARISKSLFAENVHEVAHVNSNPNPSFLKPTILGEKPTSSEFTACKTTRPTTRPFTPQKPAASKTSMIPRMMPSMSKYNPLSENLSKQSRTENATCYSQHGNKSTVGAEQQTSISSPSSKTVRDSKYRIRSDKVSAAFKPLQQVPVSPTFPRPSLLFTKEMDPDINESESASFAYNQYRHSRITTELAQNETGLEIRPTLSPAGPIPFRLRTEPPTETTMLTNIHPTTCDTAKQNMIQPQNGFPSMSTVPILQPSIPQPYSQKLASLHLIPSPIMHLEGDNPPKRFRPSIISPTLCEGICISSSDRSESFFNAKAVNHVENNVKLISTQDLTSGYKKIDDPSKIKSSKQAIDQVVVSNDSIEESLNLHEDCDRSNSASSCDDICKTSSNATNFPFEIDCFSDDIGVSPDLCTFPHSRKQIPLVPTSLESGNRTNKINKMPNESSVIEKKKCDQVIHFPSVTSQEKLNPEDGIKIRFFADETESVDSLLYDALGNQDIEPTSPKCSNFDKSNKEKRKTDDNFETFKPIRSTPFDKKEMKEKGATKNVNHTPKKESNSPDMKLRVDSKGNSRNYQYHSSKSPDGSRFLKALSNVHGPTIPDEPPTVQTPSYVRTKKKNTPNRKPYDFSSKIATPSFEEPTVLDKKVELFSSPDELKKTVVSAIGSAVETFTEMLKPVISPRLYSPEKVKPLGNEKVVESSYSQSPQKPYKERTQIVDKPLAATRTFIANFLEESGLSPLFRGEIGGTDKLESKTKTTKALTGRLAPTSSPTPSPPSKSPVLFKANEKKASPSPTKIKQKSPVLGPTVLTESNKQKPNTARKPVIKVESSPTRSNDTVKQKEIQPGKNSVKKETKPDVPTTKVEKSQLQGKQLSENPNLKTSAKQSTISPTGLPNTTKKSPEQKPDSTIEQKTQSSTIRKQVVRGKENALSAYYLDPSEYNSALTQLGEIP